MRPTHISISLTNRAGVVLGKLTLPATTLLVDLEALRNIGIVSVEEGQSMTRHSSTEQDRKMIEALRNGPVSTIEAAKNLDIVQPPNTIRRLRKRGFEIRTYWTYQSTEPGRPPHRVAKYILMREAS